MEGNDINAIVAIRNKLSGVALGLCFWFLFVLGGYLNLPRFFMLNATGVAPYFRFFLLLFEFHTFVRGIASFLGGWLTNPAFAFFGEAIPDLMYICTYITLLLCWAELYNISYDRESLLIKKSSSIRSYKLHLFLLFFIVLATATISVCYYIVSPDKAIIVTAILYLLTVPATLVFIWQEYGVFKGHFVQQLNKGDRYGFQRRRLRVCGEITLVCLITFIIRAIYDVIEVIYVPLQNEQYQWITNFLFFFFLEVIPLAIMLKIPYVLLGSSNPKPKLADLSFPSGEHSPLLSKP